MHLKTNRIVGGTETIPHSAPYTAHLDSYYGMFCTGTLIDEEWIMSAAHCLTYEKKFGYKLINENVLIYAKQ